MVVNRTLYNNINQAVKFHNSQSLRHCTRSRPSYSFKLDVINVACAISTTSHVRLQTMSSGRVLVRTYKCHAIVHAYKTFTNTHSHVCITCSNNSYIDHFNSPSFIRTTDSLNRMRINGNQKWNSTSSVSPQSR